MSTALAVTRGDHMLAPPDRHTPRAHVFSSPDEQPLEAALAETQTLLEQHGYLIALYPATLPTRYLHRLHTIRSLLESRRIALLPVALPPLATGVLVRQLRQLSLCDFTPGVLGAAARLLTHYLYAGAVLGSVARLDRVPVTLTAHAKSWMPGAQFAVLAAPTPELVRLGGEGESALTGPQFATELTVARGQLASDWVTRTLAPHWRSGEVREAYLPGDSAAWWGTGKLTEFVAAIPDVSVLYQLVASVRRDECHWCGLELIGDRCAFCAAPALPQGQEGGRAPAREQRRAPSSGRPGEPAQPRESGRPRDAVHPQEAAHPQEAPRPQGAVPPRPAAPPQSAATEPAAPTATHTDDAPVVADPRGIRR
ncbi:hypothetical protein OIE63_14710 [Streptomyces sp. NBC_01795]|nr:hypothetical protein OIE63_14710 [Streptomyces sp. NBC_01795]